MAPKWNWNQKHIWDKKAQFTIMHRKHRFCICRSRDIKRDAWHWTRLGSIGSITRLIKWRNSFCTLRPPCMNEGKWSLKVVPNVTLDIFRNSKWKRFFFLVNDLSSVTVSQHSLSHIPSLQAERQHFYHCASIIMPKIVASRLLPSAMEMWQLWIVWEKRKCLNQLRLWKHNELEHWGRGDICCIDSPSIM